MLKVAKFKPHYQMQTPPPFRKTHHQNNRKVGAVRGALSSYFSRLTHTFYICAYCYGFAFGLLVLCTWRTRKQPLIRCGIPTPSPSQTKPNQPLQPV